VLRALAKISAHGVVTTSNGMAWRLRKGLRSRTGLYGCMNALATTTLRRALFYSLAVGLVSCSSATERGSAGTVTPSTASASSSGLAGGSPSKVAEFSACPPTFASTNLNEIAGGSFAAMVPGVPAAVTICGYDLAGTPSAFARLGRSVTLGSAAAGEVATLMNALPPLPSGPTSCGSDNGTIYLLIYTYSLSGKVVNVAAEPTGCLAVVNGPRFAVIDPATKRAIVGYLANEGT
jgi:hypothetical protein